MYRKSIIIAALIVVPLFIFAQQQQHFKKVLPAGNYSGICAIGEGRYAIVDDKAETDGFRVVSIEMDSVKRRISSLVDLGYRSSGLPNRDMEGICFRPSKGDSLVHILAFGDDLKLKRQYLYQPDAPMSSKHIYGISELCALEDGRLLVMERQVRVPRLKIGASTLVRIYEVMPGNNDRLTKKLVTEFRTRLSITSRKFANFEGLCQVAPHCLLLLADSQNQYKGVLRDWFMCLPF